jgi:hypothetical protein
MTDPEIGEKTDKMFDEVYEILNIKNPINKEKPDKINVKPVNGKKIRSTRISRSFRSDLNNLFGDDGGDYRELSYSDSRRLSAVSWGEYDLSSRGLL